jgi:hypothetical protein
VGDSINAYETPALIYFSPPKTNLANHTAIVDTGATGHYLDPAAGPHCINVRTTNSKSSVQVANGKTIKTSKRAIVPPAPKLLDHTKTGHIFDRLKSGSLISISQLCNNNCVALFTKYDVKLFKNGQVIIVGQRNTANGLWTISLAPKVALLPLQIPAPLSTCRHSANSAIPHLSAKHNLAAFLHAFAFSLLPSTFLRAIQRGHFDSWSGLTSSLVTKHLPKLLATSKGHLCMEQKAYNQQNPSP